MSIVLPNLLVSNPWGFIFYDQKNFIGTIPVQLSLRVRSHGLLVYRLCLLPDTPIIFISYLSYLDRLTARKYNEKCHAKAGLITQDYI